MWNDPRVFSGLTLHKMSTNDDEIISTLYFFVLVRPYVMTKNEVNVVCSVGSLSASAWRSGSVCLLIILRSSKRIITFPHLFLVN